MIYATIDDMFKPDLLIRKGMYIKLDIGSGELVRPIIKEHLFMNIHHDREKTPMTYIILNSSTLVFYIGSTGRGFLRLINHRNQLIREVHKSKLMQESFHPYRLDEMLVSKIYTNDLNEARNIEQYLLDLYFNHDLCSNSSPTSISCKGVKFSDEAKKKLSDAHKGKPLSEQNKRKISQSLKGRIFSESHKEKIRNNQTGRTHNIEMRKKTFRCS